jgi:CheY-like chemotaxis protein
MDQKAILCVDDEEMILMSLKDQLQNHFYDEYQYEFAESADEAFEVIEELYQEGMEVLIIVSDWLMPGMKGDELLIKIHKKYPDIVTVMLTGQADEDAILKVKEKANLHRCLYKPWTEEELIETLKTGLGKK